MIHGRKKTIGIKTMENRYTTTHDLIGWRITPLAFELYLMRWQYLKWGCGYLLLWILHIDNIYKGTMNMLHFIYPDTETCGG